MTRKEALRRAALLAARGYAQAARLLVKQYVPVGRVIPAIEVQVYVRPKGPDHRKL